MVTTAVQRSAGVARMARTTLRFRLGSSTSITASAPVALRRPVAPSTANPAGTAAPRPARAMITDDTTKPAAAIAKPMSRPSGRSRSTICPARKAPAAMPSDSPVNL